MACGMDLAGASSLVEVEVVDDREAFRTCIQHDSPTSRGLGGNSRLNLIEPSLTPSAGHANDWPTTATRVPCKAGKTAVSISHLPATRHCYPYVSMAA